MSGLAVGRRWLDRARALRTRAEPVSRRIAPFVPALRIIGYIAAVAIVVYIGIRAARGVRSDELSWWPLPFAVILAAGWWLLLAHGWALLAAGTLTKGDISVWCRTQTLRYLPGGIWAPVSRVTVLHGGVIDRVSTVAAENVVALCAALAIGGTALTISGRPLYLPLVLAVVAPTIASRYTAAYTRLAPERTRKATVNYLVAFLGYAGSAVFVQGAVSGFSHPFAVAGAAAIAWGAGLVVVFAPSGVGIRELAYVGLLSHVLPSSELAAGAVTMRIVTVVAELGVLLVAGRPQRTGAVVRSLRASGLAFARHHAVFLSLFGAGAALRLVTWLAYRPALIYYDSVGYLGQSVHLAPGETRPLGYPAFLSILPGHSLAVIPAVQHVMGLAIAVLIYVLLSRLGVRRWVAALAAAPILLDAYQLVMEEYVLSEALFELLIVAGCVVLLWRRRPGIPAAVVAGLLFAATALTRANGLVVIAPAVLAVVFLHYDKPGELVKRGGRSLAGLGRRALASTRALRPGVGVAAVMVVVFAAPLAGYATWFHKTYGQYAITNSGGRFLYARVAPFADCSKFSVPANERILCPQQRVGHRPELDGSTVNWYMWARWSPNRSPIYNLGSADARRTLPGDFAKRVIKAQPVAYFRAVSHDFLRGFAPTRTHHGGELPISRWQFQVDFPIFSRLTQGILRAHGDGPAQVRPTLTRKLRAYQRFGFIPGPLLAIGLLAGLLAALGIGRARGSGLRTAAFLFAAMGLVTFGSAVLTNQFMWRYQVLELVFFPPAAALGLTALVRRRPSIAAEAADPPGGTSQNGQITARKAPQPDAPPVSEPTFG